MQQQDLVDPILSILFCSNLPGLHSKSLPREKSVQPSHRIPPLQPAASFCHHPSSKQWKRRDPISSAHCCAGSCLSHHRKSWLREDSSTANRKVWSHRPIKRTVKLAPNRIKFRFNNRPLFATVTGAFLFVSSIAAAHTVTSNYYCTCFRDAGVQRAEATRARETRMRHRAQVTPWSVRCRRFSGLRSALAFGAQQKQSQGAVAARMQHFSHGGQRPGQSPPAALRLRRLQPRLGGRLAPRRRSREPRSARRHGAMPRAAAPASRSREPRRGRTPGWHLPPRAATPTAAGCLRAFRGCRTRFSG